MPFKIEALIYTTDQAPKKEQEEREIRDKRKQQEEAAAERARRAQTSAKPCKVFSCQCQNFIQVPGSDKCDRSGCSHLESEHR